MSGSVSLGGDVRKLMRHLSKLENIDMAGVNARLAAAMKTSTKKRFKSETAPDGVKWKQSVRARENGGQTLSDSARLKNSIRSKSEEGGFAVGTNVIYSRRHQLGDKRPVLIKAKGKHGLRFKIGGRWMTKNAVRVKLPARPFLGISEDDKETIKATLEEEVSKNG